MTAPTPPAREPRPPGPDRLREVLRSPGYLRGLVFCALIGVPVSLAAFWFLVGINELEHALWDDLPHAAGWTDPPWWWPLPLALVPGTVVALVATRLPGKGGHIPADGLHAGGATAEALPGVLLAAAASLPFGAVLGPEAPLIALGGGLALLFSKLVRAEQSTQGSALLGAAGAASALSAIFGNALVGAVLLIEVSGVGGTQLLLIMLPALLASGVGSLVFTGFGRWTGFETGSLDIGLPTSGLPDVGDVAWGLLLAVAVGATTHLVLAGGRRAERFVAARPVRNTLICAVAAAACCALYAVVTGRSPADAALSGEAALAGMASDPTSWATWDLVAVLACKAVAYALCLGSLRGGPVFPALFLGGAAGLLCSPLPGFGVVPAMAAGMAASVASVLRLPVSGLLLVVLLLGGVKMVPVAVLAAVAAIVTTELLPRSSGRGRAPAAGGGGGDADGGGAGDGGNGSGRPQPA
ncbi:chloride channel protein [Streptomyces sp. bgisy100]|uniref:chloride channel protein n=1 Tax=Streptomyces sp. bgisy100 TaxID=3413783 RepID=UPI003D70F81C